MGLSSFTDGGCILKIKLLSINKTTFIVTRLLLYLNLGIIESISVLHNSPMNAPADRKQGSVACHPMGFPCLRQARTQQAALESLPVPRPCPGLLGCRGLGKTLWGSKERWQTSLFSLCHVYERMCIIHGCVLISNVVVSFVFLSISLYLAQTAHV